MKKLTIQLFVTSIVLAFVGLIFIYSTSAYFANERFGDGFHYVKKQLLWILIGFIVQLICMKLNYQWYKKYALHLMVFNFVLLVGVLLPGLSVEVGGARRWLRIAGFSIQPSEFCKLVTIVFMAKMLALSHDRPQIRIKIYGILALSLMAVLALILAERDLGTTVILGSTIFVLLYIAGLHWGYLASICVLMVPFLYLAITRYAFRMQRIMIYLDPWQDPQNSGYQIIQSMVAIASGGIGGRGLGQSVQKYYYLPEAHTDFIFSIYAEETGLVGSLLLVGLFIILLILAKRVAMRCQDLFGHLLAVGITFLFGVQVFINIGVVTALLPTKGTTLPFVSFGGTSLVVNMAAIGILISIEKFVRKTDRELE